MIFDDRHQAGLLLAERVKPLQPEAPIILALPRGGVPVARPIADRLAAPLNVLGVKKLGAPRSPEFGVGAVTEGGRRWLNPAAVSGLGLTASDFSSELERKLLEAQAMAHRLRGGRPLPDLRGRTIILVDDGLAMGVTAVAGALEVRARGAARVVLAVPVASPQSLRELPAIFDEVIALHSPRDFSSVGLFYEDFSQISEEEALRTLTQPAPLRIPYRGHADFPGELTLPPSPSGLVVFAHGSGSSHRSPRNRYVAERLQREGFGTFLFDLLTAEESRDRELVFDTAELGDRLRSVIESMIKLPSARGLPIALFGASTGAAAALRAAADLKSSVRAVISRGGRPDLAADRFSELRAPVLLLVGSEDHEVLELNRFAQARLQAATLSVIPGAGHLFEEPGALEEVALRATRWLKEKIEPQEERNAA